MSIAQWPEAERPREKLLSRGPNALSDAELLAIFLRTGCAGKSAVDLARDLLLRFGGFWPLLEAGHEEFCQGQGLGPRNYAPLQAGVEIGRRLSPPHIRERDRILSTDIVPLSLFLD